MAWPNPSDYQEALQNPQRAFSDPELRRGVVTLTRLGLPRPISGNFATVFEVTSGARRWAVRCFSREVSDQQQRYSAIHEYLLHRSLPYMAGFEYLPQGILVRGRWYPVVKMEWIEGDQLDTFIRKNLRSAQQIQLLAHKWLELVHALRAAAIAHGDLQHGNVIVTPQGNLRLVDYDGMVIQALAGQKMQEVGHRHYQHPSRTLNTALTQANYVNLDNFSAWVIGISLALVWLDPDLWVKTQAGEDSLLFQEMDYKQPGRSATLRLLQNHEDVRVRNIGGRLLALIDTPSYLLVPPLNGAEAGIVRRSAKEWMGSLRSEPEEHRPKSAPVIGRGWIQDHLPAPRASRPASRSPSRAAPSAAPRPARPSDQPPARAPSHPPVPAPGKPTSGRQAAWLLGVAQTLDPLPKVQFPPSLVSDEVALYLAEKQNRPMIMQLVFSVRRFVGRRFPNYLVVVQKKKTEAVCNEARLEVIAAERELRESHAEIDRLRSNLEAERHLLRQDIDSLTAQINASYQREKEEIQAAAENARRHHTGQQLALYALSPGAISGFGRVRIDALNRVGIYTAADITSHNEPRAVFALGTVRGAAPRDEWQMLVHWRENVEFSIRRMAAPPAAEISRIKTRHDTQRREWMRLRDTRQAHLRIVDQQVQSAPQLRQLENEIQVIQHKIAEKELNLVLAERELAQFSEITPGKFVEQMRGVLSSL